jgi:multidrug efflux pump subunit AcrA (membrane-fusion protein)
MMRYRWMIAAMVTALSACGADEPPATEPLPVTVATVGTTGGDLKEARYGGAIEADASVDVAFRMSGVVEAVTMVRGADGRFRTLQDGDLVRRGTVLARLRQNEFRDQVSDAEASLQQAQADYERAAQLYENRSVSKAEYDAAYARYTAGKARRSQAAI